MGDHSCATTDGAPPFTQEGGAPTTEGPVFHPPVVALRRAPHRAPELDVGDDSRTDRAAVRMPRQPRSAGGGALWYGVIQVPRVATWPRRSASRGGRRVPIGD